MTTRNTMRTNLAIMLGDRGGTEWDDLDYDRAISMAVEELSRYHPLESVAEINFNLDIADESFTSSYGVAVSLTASPMEPKSETVTSDPAGTTFDREDDYELDYINGTITVLSTGAMADATGFLITYQRDQTLINLTSVMTKQIEIQLVEYRVGQVPQSMASFDVHGNFLTILSVNGRTQSRISDDTNLRIWYTAFHTDPGDSTSGSFNRVFDELVQLGAAGQALRIKAMEMELQAKTDLAANVTALALADDRLTTITTAQDDANVAFDRALASAAEASVALDKIATLIAEYRGSAGEPYDDALTAIAVAVADAVKIGTELDGMDALFTAADLIFTAVEKAADLAPEILGDLPSEVDTAIQHLESLKSDGTSSGTAINADSYLETGDSLINVVNEGGPNVAAIYAQYAQVQTQEAQVLGGLANTRVASASVHVQEAQIRVAEAQAKVGELNAKASQAQLQAAQAQMSVSIVQGYVQIAGILNLEAQNILVEAQAEVATAQVYVAGGNGRLSQMAAELNLWQGYLNQSAGYQASAQRDIETALNLNQEAALRLEDFRFALRDRSQYGTQSNLVARRQNP